MKLHVLSALLLGLWDVGSTLTQHVRNRQTRLDDANCLDAVMSTVSKDIGRLEAQLNALQNSAAEKTAVSLLQAEVQSLKSLSGKRSAFLAKLPANPQACANSPVVFSTVVFNIGNNYDPLLGVYTVPYAGVYQFSFQVFPKFVGEMLADLVKNGVVILRLRVHDDSWHTSEASTVLQHAVPGDKYWVQVSKGGQYWGTINTFFTGTLISADD